MKTMDNVICFNKTVLDALRTISELPSEDSLTLFVVNDQKKLIGSLTDGDIRRSILGGVQLEDPLMNAICKNFIYIDKSAGLAEIIDLFQNDKLEFLPVLKE